MSAGARSVFADEDETREPLQVCQRSFEQRYLRRPGADERVLASPVRVPQLGACEAARYGVADPWHAQQPWREQISYPTTDPRMQRCTARHQAGLTENPPADGMTFALVGVEHILRSTAEDRVQFPRQVHGVLYPGVHALPAHRRMHVCGVAREKNTAVPVFGHLALVAVKPRQPTDLAHPQIAAHRAGEHIDHLGGGGWLGVGYLMVAIPHHRPVPRAVVVAPVVRCEKSDHVTRAAEGELSTRRPVGQLHVREHHRRQDRLAGELRADEIPHGAVCAVCADHVFRAPCLAVSRIVVVLCPRRDRHAVGILFECNDFETPADVRALVGGVFRERRCPRSFAA